MKKTKKVLALALSLCLAVGTFAGSISTLAACSPETPNVENPDDPNGGGGY